MHVTILYNEPVLSPQHSDFESEREVIDTVAIAEGFLCQAGFQVDRLGVGREPRVLFDGFKACRPDVVFNLFEGHADQGHTETLVAGMLEWLGIPFTGCPALALGLARTKDIAKFLFRGAGIPTPDFVVVNELPAQPCNLGWPVIVKPAHHDASVGLDHGSVVSEPDALARRIGLLLERYGPPVLVEEFIAGRELSVGLIEAPELRMLPVGEVAFGDQGPGSWPIVTYDAKWTAASKDFAATPSRYPADVEPPLSNRLKEIAESSFRLLGCRDYARVDFRVRDNEPYVLEVNPNPDLHPEGGLAQALWADGIGHAAFAVQIVKQALVRSPRP
jgi:D-alanine-D-alanine ligase